MPEPRPDEIKRAATDETDEPIARNQGSTRAHWSRRLFQNTYTRDGQQFRLAGWSVKIQHQGRRHTFSLAAGTKAAAAAEAKAIHDTLLAEGWEAALRTHARPGGTEGEFPKSDVRYWQERLLLRRYWFAAGGGSPQDLAVRVDHAGLGYFFPLGTAQPAAAAAAAHRIYWTVVERGWEAAYGLFPRELVVGFEWCANPVMWTYTTIHTLMGEEPAGAARPARRPAESQCVLVVEPDASIRRALAWSINQQSPGLRSVTCDAAEDFTLALGRHQPRLVLLNRALAGPVGYASPGQFGRHPQGVPVLTYSICADGDQLFTSTPGGAEAYLLKRTPPERLLEPVLNLASQPDQDPQMDVKAYFKGLLRPESGPESAALAKLTRREHEVLVLMAKGWVDKEIAQALKISAWTVHAHVKNIFERLRVRTRTEAVVRFLEK